MYEVGVPDSFESANYPDSLMECLTTEETFWSAGKGCVLQYSRTA